MYVDDLGKFRGEKDATSEFQLVCAISSEPADLYQALPYLQAEFYLIPVGDTFNVQSC